MKVDRDKRDGLPLPRPLYKAAPKTVRLQYEHGAGTESCVVGIGSSARAEGPVRRTRTKQV